MKLRSLVLLAALGFGLTACNDDGDDLLKDNETKSVTISLANVLPQSKGTGTQIANGTKVKLNDWYVVFTDGKALYTGYDLTGGKQQPASKYYDAATTSHTFHYVNGAANKAIVIGNVGGENGALSTALENCADLASLNAIIREMTGEQDADALTLYGVGDFTKDDNNDTEGHSNFYKANINVTPLIARVEVTGFKYTGTKYTSIALNHIAIDKYYNAVTLAGATSGDISFANVAGTGNSQNFFAGLTTKGWMHDAITNATLTDGQLVEASDLLTAANENAYVYHVAAGQAFPVPHIVLDMVGTLAEGTTQMPLHIVAKGLKTTESLTNLEPGKIYRLSFEFTDADLEQPAKCVEVTVTVADWVVEVVTPQFS